MNFSEVRAEVIGGVLGGNGVLRIQLLEPSKSHIEFPGQRLHRSILLPYLSCLLFDFVMLLEKLVKQHRFRFFEE